MKCKCGAISTILVENEDGTITPKCETCYYDPIFNADEVEKAIKASEKRLNAYKPHNKPLHVDQKSGTASTE